MVSWWSQVLRRAIGVFDGESKLYQHGQLEGHDSRSETSHIHTADVWTINHTTSIDHIYIGTMLPFQVDIKKIQRGKK